MLPACSNASERRPPKLAELGGCVALATVEGDQLWLALKLRLGVDRINDGLVQRSNVVIAHKLCRVAVPTIAEDKAIVSRPHLARQHLPKPLEHRSATRLVDPRRLHTQPAPLQCIIELLGREVAVYILRPAVPIANRHGDRIAHPLLLNCNGLRDRLRRHPQPGKAGQHAAELCVHFPRLQQRAQASFVGAARVGHELQLQITTLLDHHHLQLDGGAAQLEQRAALPHEGAARGVTQVAAAGDALEGRGHLLAQPRRHEARVVPLVDVAEVPLVLARGGGPRRVEARRRCRLEAQRHDVLVGIGEVQEQPCFAEHVAVLVLVLLAAPEEGEQVRIE
eukprot:scaffold48761_cov60-Phaeocystis_antarctica.AAC.2